MTSLPPILLIGEAPGAEEDRIKSSFVGASGIELLRMLDEAKVITLSSFDHDYIRLYWETSNAEYINMVWNLHPEVLRTNVFSTHPHANDVASFCGPKTTAIPGYPALTKSKYVQSTFAHELDRLGDEIIHIDPNLIIALGNTPLWALTGRTGVSKLRGTTLPSTHTAVGYKVLSTYHPAAVLRQWELRSTTIADLMKAAREAAYPEIRRPPRSIWIEPSLADMELFYETYIKGTNLLSVDIETSGNQVTCIGFAPSRSIAIVVPFTDFRRPDRSYWHTSRDERDAWVFVRRVLTDATIPKLFQNGMYDIAFLWRSVGIGVLGAKEDTMLLHHALQPESLKSLGYLGSLYTNQDAWKQMRKTTETLKRDA